MSRLNFVPSSYETGDQGGANGHMELRDARGLPGYDLDYGNGSETLAQYPNMQARGFRQERILMTHDAMRSFEGDDEWADEGFRWRATHDGV